MGYRYQIMSLPIDKELPDWFKDKYKDKLNFGGFLTSKGAYKLSETLYKIEWDLQRSINEIDIDNIQLVYFEECSDDDNPDIIYTLITKDKIETKNFNG